ncbi:hypothetical protein HZA76_01750 [Candidatus Roizmanbacteria bacterium]|nr:hypothetical protein [Candidatus Roizmanbacteria bacterium]
MTRISRFPVDDKVLEKLYLLMFEVVSSMDEEEEFSKIINELLSPTEKIMIAKRIAIIYLLMKKINYTNISDVLKVSSETIAKFKMIMIKNGEIKKVLGGIVGVEKVKNFFEELLTSEPGTYGVDWKLAWKKKIEIQRRKVRGI